MPFPNDFFTGRRRRAADRPARALRPRVDAANSSGVPIDPTEWNRNDGFSPGSMIVTYVARLDLARTGAAPITDIGASLRPDQPIVLLDTDTGRRWPFFAELDAQADRPPTAVADHPARRRT